MHTATDFGAHAWRLTACFHGNEATGSPANAHVRVCRPLERSGRSRPSKPSAVPGPNAPILPGTPGYARHGAGSRVLAWSATIAEQPAPVPSYFLCTLGPPSACACLQRQALIGTGRLLVRIDMDLPPGALTPHCNRQLDVASTNSAPPTSGGKCFEWFLWNSDVACNALGAPDGEIQGAFPCTLGLWRP